MALVRVAVTRAAAARVAALWRVAPVTARSMHSLIRTPPPPPPSAIEARPFIDASFVPAGAPFRLPPAFLASFAARPPPFGFNGLGEFVFATRYARVKPDGGGVESWVDTVQRVVEGVFEMQRHWRLQQSAPTEPWDEAAAMETACSMFERIWSMRFLPPGRGLWAMGTPVTRSRHLYAALNNCAFISTWRGDGSDDPAAPFAFLMDAAMLGVGVGFDTAAAGRLHVAGAAAPTAASPFVIEDSREGWVASTAALLRAHFAGGPRPAFDYTRIRPRGTPIRGFGGTASGPEVLAQLHHDLDAVLARLAGRMMTITAVVDVMNLIGRCIVSGDVRQTAEIAFGDPASAEYLDLKDYTANPARAAYGWTSNNSVYATLGMRYDDVVRRVVVNGEPGFAWLDNMRRFHRMDGRVTDGDPLAAGGNPCLEQTLESGEMCCLVETFPAAHTDLDDYKRTLELALLYAKTVTLGATTWPTTNAIMARNRRIGCSVSGVAQFVAARGMETLRQWCDEGYTHVRHVDETLSRSLGVPRSIKLTSVKPSGTVSLLAGATPGVHHPESRFYLRRVRIGRTHPLVPRLTAAGYALEPAVEDPTRKLVVSFPVDAGAGVRTLETVSMWEQLAMAAFMQRWWADNQVRCAVPPPPPRRCSVTTCMCMPCSSGGSGGNCAVLPRFAARRCRAQSPLTLQGRARSWPTPSTSTNTS